ncbi:izumo sperm-egg fusion protein 1 [Sarcophilus harrisii]|uniref:izumo sperm-egg fusion protein 1 n=1 Tax=Sarcophilus harrisii TaxID=9305 RepID=UPI001301F186|nr:izumo sperm-egg fusion protein 1 [Sarcophilus harrisii]
MGDVVKAARLQGMRPEEPRWGSPGAGLSFSRRGSLLHSALPLGLVVLGLALSSRRAWGCVLCDPAVVAGLRDLEQEYLPSHLDVDPKVLQIFVSRLEETVRQFIDLPFNPASYQGLIDEPTLSKVSWDFLKELKRIRDSNLKDSFLLKELTWTLHMQKENFARMAAEFQRESFCPNKCGERAALPSQASPRAPAKASTDGPLAGGDPGPRWGPGRPRGPGRRTARAARTPFTPLGSRGPGQSGQTTGTPAAGPPLPKPVPWKAANRDLGGVRRRKPPSTTTLLPFPTPQTTLGGLRRLAGGGPRGEFRGGGAWGAPPPP